MEALLQAGQTVDPEREMQSGMLGAFRIRRNAVNRESGLQQVDWTDDTATFISSNTGETGWPQATENCERLRLGTEQ